MIPPGFSTRASSAAAARSSGMCSITSEQMMRSKVSSGNGSRVPSPFTQRACESRGTSSDSVMAASVARTSFSSAPS